MERHQGTHKIGELMCMVASVLSELPFYQTSRRILAPPWSSVNYQFVNLLIVAKFSIGVFCAKSEAFVEGIDGELDCLGFVSFDSFKHFPFFHEFSFL